MENNKKKKKDKKNITGEKIRRYLTEKKESFCRVVTCRKNIERDIFIIVCMIFISCLIIMSNIPSGSEYVPKVAFEGEKISAPVIPNEDDKVADIQASTNFDDWKSFKNQWYGFEIKYPGNWKIPTVQKVVRGSKWTQKYQFRKDGAGDDSGPYIGYDVVIYDIDKIKNVEDTDEFIKKTGGEFSEKTDCWQITGHLLENEAFPAERIYIPPGDNCYQTDLFYNLIRDEYIYNIVPIRRDGDLTDGDPRSNLLENFPEFYSVATTLNLIDIVRPKTAPVKPRITAPIPYVFDMKNGRRVCNRKNDHPSKSKNNKKGHMDMECCLDPDETPNPNCYYLPGIYGKYL
jgi:hypothetical protein